MLHTIFFDLDNTLYSRDCGVWEAINDRINLYIETILQINKNAESLIIDSKEYFINNLLCQKNDLKKIEEDLKYNKGFLKSIQSQLNNKKFMDNAPKIVVENEKKKEEDTRAKIKILEIKLKK